MNKQKSHNTSLVINSYLKQSQQTFNSTKLFVTLTKQFTIQYVTTAMLVNDQMFVDTNLSMRCQSVNDKIFADISITM